MNTIPVNMAGSAGAGKAADSRRLMMEKDWLFTLALFIAVFLAYAPAWNGSPVWDDNAHMTRSDLRSVNGLVRIWVEPGATQQYYPLVHSVFWVEHRLWGDNPAGYHLLNILLHALSAFLLYKILKGLDVPGARLAAIVFALHPVQAESVAWISELKNTLSGFFFLLAAGRYLKFDRDRSRTARVFAFFFFVLGLLSKTVIAPLPAALLVVFWWKRGRVRLKEDFLPLAPFFIAGLAGGLFTAWVEQKFTIGTTQGGYDISAIERGIIACRAIWFYLGKLFLPLHLTFIYPRWEIHQANLRQYLIPAVTVAVLIALGALSRRSRAPLAALLYFAVMLFSALGFFNIYPFRYSFVADHWQYLAGIGPLALASAGVNSAASRLSHKIRFAKPAVFGFLVVTLGTLTFLQSGMYRDNETLYRTTIKKNPRCWMAYNNLGVILADKGMADEAGACFRKALQLNPRYAEALTGLGDLLLTKGYPDEAIARFKEALSIDPGYTSACDRLAAVLEQTGNPDEAISWYRRALVINPRDELMHYRLGCALMRSRSIGEAIVQFTDAVAANPYDGDAGNALGVALAQEGRIDEAIASFRKAVAVDPADEIACCNLGDACLKSGRADSAAVFFRMAVKINPHDLNASTGLSAALAQMGLSGEAAGQQGRMPISPSGPMQAQ
jgi:Flp pilus assembly protein TadD